MRRIPGCETTKTPSYDIQPPPRVIWIGISWGRTPFLPPFAIGQEVVGEVVDVDDAGATAGLRPGQRVVIPWHLSCERCADRLAGRPGKLHEHSRDGFLYDADARGG